MDQCSCGSNYFKDARFWHVLPLHNELQDANRSAFHVVYVLCCPNCRGLIIRVDYADRDYLVRSFNTDNRGRMSGQDFLVTDLIERARQVYPPPSGPTRSEINLLGVPEHISRDYRTALKVLDDPETYPYANVLARRSLETSLEKYRKDGERAGLGTLIDRLLSDAENGLSRPLLDSLDAIRKLGDMEAHHFLNADGEIVEVTRQETAWNISILERFLQDWYVRPAQDAAFRDSLEGKLSTLANADNRPLKQPPG